MKTRRKECTYEEKIGILLTAATILSCSLGAFASASTHEGMYNGKWYKVSGSIPDTKHASASMHYAGGGLVSVQGVVQVDMGNYYSENPISGYGTGSALASFSITHGDVYSLSATGYVGTAAVDGVGFRYQP